MEAPVTGSFSLTRLHTAGGTGGTIQCGIIFMWRCTMNGKYQPGQKVFLTGGNKNLIKEATVLKYTGGFYTIRFENGGGVKVRESRIYPSREEAEAAILNRAR